jgi:hypothetical protein
MRCLPKVWQVVLAIEKPDTEASCVPEETRNIVRHDQPHEMTAAVGSVELIFGRPHGVV